MRKWNYITSRRFRRLGLQLPSVLRKLVTSHCAYGNSSLVMSRTMISDMVQYIMAWAIMVAQASELMLKTWAPCGVGSVHYDYIILITKNT